MSEYHVGMEVGVMRIIPVTENELVLRLDRESPAVLHRVIYYGDVRIKQEGMGMVGWKETTTYRYIRRVDSGNVNYDSVQKLVEIMIRSAKVWATGNQAALWAAGIDCRQKLVERAEGEVRRAEKELAECKTKLNGAEIELSEYAREVARLVKS